MQYKLVVFDLDYTLTDGFSLYSEVRPILQELKKNGCIIALASYNSNAASVLLKHDIHSFFDHILCENWKINNLVDWKHKMLTYLLAVTQVPSHEIIFYDDYHKNLITAKNLGICPVKVCPEQGLNINLIESTMNIKF